MQLKRVIISCLALSCVAGTAVLAKVAEKPVYRDPVYDGAADVSIVYDRRAHVWKMFYTNRRATMRLPDHDDVAWVHATKIGIATSSDGATWTYQGTADLPAACTDVTSWAPELFYENGTYHMWLTVIPGIFHRWGTPGAGGKIVHLTSPDLNSWSCSDQITIDANRKIDASVLKVGNAYRLWYKDEKQGSRILAAESTDLRNWSKLSDTPVTETRGEGPKVFRFNGYYWMIADAWKGLMVLRSKDATTWIQQSGFILAEPGKAPTDTSLGQHADVVVSGGHAYLYYFVHQSNEPEAKTDPYWNQRTVIQVTELKYKNGTLSVDRNAATDVRLRTPRD